MLRRRLLEIIAVAAALLIGVVVWVVRISGPDSPGDTDAEPTNVGSAVEIPAKDIHDVSIDIDLEDISLALGDDVDVAVHNESGKALANVQFDLKIEDPGGDFPYVGVTGGDENCDWDEDAQKRRPKAERRVCEKRWAAGKEWCKPKIEFPEPSTRHSWCWGTLDPGTNLYLYDMGLSTAEARVDEVAPEQVEGYPDLTVTAELSVDGEVFADFKGTITGDKVQP
ncbi:hypothetical protein [Stackebrandtia nassauensis]|uniref:Uncharacterized protein n=1 Tax=Stackebrandtia nassauensis (strain DSM 44728 / CIP 108903 / NRRL B-16338 / NBRC 102104 / LLR-40K-21) TaxID=446470 RepID=D3PU22_STANL|nr:hypothetical protein [Stackebrandtia nassauensis]ADD40968.1 hypothetical protein Snas_1259 [Stackebrandtia nassauensis DSM 44728]